jgi:hypothetical protein
VLLALLDFYVFYCGFSRSSHSYLGPHPPILEEDQTFKRFVLPLILVHNETSVIREGFGCSKCESHIEFDPTIPRGVNVIRAKTS